VDNHESKAVKPETNNETPTDGRRKLVGKELMAWNIKAHPHPTLSIDVGMAIVGILPVSLTLYGFFADDGAPLHIVGPVIVCVWLVMWLRGARQKNVYQYRITDQGGEVRYWEDYPKGFGTFFKWLSGIFLFAVICMIAVEPSFIWLLVGPGGMALAGARFFFGWEREVRTGRFRWERVNRIVIDKKRKVVVMTRHDDPKLSFEENYLCFEAFLTKEQIEGFVRMVKLYAEKTTDFEEARWIE
jgi:hypothetical protein